jgi:hypothetical protein
VPVFFLLTLVVAVLTIIDVAKAPDHEVRTLPKPAWLLIVLFMPLLGAIGWFIAGRPDSVSWTSKPRSTSAFPEYDRPGRSFGTNSAADEEFLRQCRERAEQQRRKHREEQKRRERDGE